MTAGVYTLQVVETDKELCIGLPKTVVVTVNPLPEITLSGPAIVCLNSTDNVYTTESGMSDYNWSVTGGTITSDGGASDNKVTVTWNGTGPYTVSVNYANATGCTAGEAKVTTVTVNPLLVPTLSANDDPVCFGTSGVVYETEAGMSNYVWVVIGGSISAGGASADNTVTVTWNGTGTHSVSVHYINQNGCTSGTPTVSNINVLPLPATSPIYHD
jgi:hypothetical protein